MLRDACKAMVKQSNKLLQTRRIYIQHIICTIPYVFIHSVYMPAPTFKCTQTCIAFRDKHTLANMKFLLS